MSAAPQSVAKCGELHWLKPDAFHIRTDCGRYTVSRVTLPNEHHYVAWERGERDSDGVRIKPLVELGCAKLPLNATDRERQEAIRAMQKLCVDHALEEATRP